MPQLLQRSVPNTIRFIILMLAMVVTLAALPSTVSAQSNIKGNHEDIWNTYSTEQQNELISFLFAFPYSDIDINQMDDAKIIEFIQHSMFDGQIGVRSQESEKSIDLPSKNNTSDSEPYDWYYYPHSYNALNKVSNQLFGRSLERKENSYAYFIDGSFYLPEFGFGSNPAAESVQVNRLYELENNIYFAEFDRYTIEEENNKYNIIHKMAQKGKSTWIADDDIYVSQGNIGYTFIRKEVINGKTDWKMIKYYENNETLNMEQIEQYVGVLKEKAAPPTWAIEEINQAIALDLIPDTMQSWYTSNITRSEFSTLIIQLITKSTGNSIDIVLNKNDKKINSLSFKDTNNVDVLAANALGIVNGKGNQSFDPDGFISREEAAVMLTRTAKFLGETATDNVVQFSDVNKFSSWAKDSVKFISSMTDKSNNSAVMGSTGSNNFSPKGYYTKQQAFITVKRLYNAIEQ